MVDHLFPTDNKRVILNMFELRKETGDRGKRDVEFPCAGVFGGTLASRISDFRDYFTDFGFSGCPASAGVYLESGMFLSVGCWWYVELPPRYCIKKRGSFPADVRGFKPREKFSTFHRW